MTNHAWLLSPLMTSVFFVLGVALFFQVIMQMLALNYAKLSGPLLLLNGFKE
ncbi:hypothetical protein [Lentilactobacillus kosonis]|uniref:Uncharacterized protein n=1 Tax=Lentilactobacillus kosonis TaxID=2810561 RepID=A0A401FM36_9LACO|nr:hypothetical protein [Lentilactobacillus kosonis]GAY73440.1 hypothetical protein NBRC111893_1586 [Lentilactobacillus kosonis]